MSQRIQSSANPKAASLAAGLACFVGLSGLFLYTMLLHYRSIDWGYLGFGLPRFAALSLFSALASYLIGRRVSWPVAALLGSAFGIFLGFTYVYASVA